LAVAPQRVLFLTDVVAEADAATKAGVVSVLLVRPGNAPLPPAYQAAVDANGKGLAASSASSAAAKSGFDSVEGISHVEGGDEGDGAVATSDGGEGGALHPVAFDFDGVDKRFVRCE
jgi:hypothetical protein